MHRKRLCLPSCWRCLAVFPRSSNRFNPDWRVQSRFPFLVLLLVFLPVSVSPSLLQMVHCHHPHQWFTPRELVVDSFFYRVTNMFCFLFDHQSPAHFCARFSASQKPSQPSLVEGVRIVRSAYKFLLNRRFSPHELDGLQKAQESLAAFAVERMTRAAHRGDCSLSCQPGERGK